MGGTGWCQGAPVFIEVGDWGRPQALFLACGMRRKGLLPVSLNTDFRVHCQTASYLNVVFLERDFQEKAGFSMGEQGGREACQEEVTSRHQRVGRSPLPQQKQPKTAYGMLGLWTHGLWLSLTDHSGRLFRIGTFSHHQGIVQHPHFVHGNRKHDQKRDRHEHVARQQGQHEEGRHVGDQPR